MEEHDGQHCDGTQAFNVSTKSALRVARFRGPGFGAERFGLAERR
jgi:hypothetical protein